MEELAGGRTGVKVSQSVSIQSVSQCTSLVGKSVSMNLSVVSMSISESVSQLSTSVNQSKSVRASLVSSVSCCNYDKTVDDFF